MDALSENEGDTAMSAGGSQSKQSSSSSSNSFIDPTQAGFLGNMWGQAQGITDPNAVGQAASNAAGMNSPFLQGAMNTMSGLMDPQGQIAAQSASLQSGLGDLFRNEINPAIQSNAVAMGGLGGGRQGVAEGVATGQLANAYTQGLGDITARANAQAGASAAMMPGLTEANMGNTMAGQLGGYAPLQQLAQILGNPAILQEMQSKSKGKTESFNFGMPGFGM